MTDHPSSPDATSSANPDWAALARHLAGEGTPAERQALRAELEASPDRAALIEALDGALQPVPMEPPVDVEGALDAVRCRRDAAPVLALHSSPRRAAGAWRLAAGILVLAAAGAGLYRFASPQRQAAPSAQLAAHHAAPVGQSKSVLLADGTRVVLAPGSALDVGAGYGASSRALSLDGEALFVVVHDAARPFTVHAGGAVVRDVGTQFTVRAGDGDGDGEVVRVSVASGEVELSARGAVSPAPLRAGDVGELRQGRIVVTRGAADADDAAFAQGKLVWRDAPIDRVRADLRRWYGVTLVVPDSTLAKRHLTASFTSESSDEALRVVAAALGGDLRRRGDTATVRAPTPTRTAPR